MPETVFDLPVHPLVVHGPAVLVPVSSVLVILVAVSPERRRRWGVLTWLLTTAAVGATVAAKLSGEQLKQSLFQNTPSAEVVQHADYGSSSVWFVGALWLAVSAMLLLDLDRNRRDGLGTPLLPAILSVVAIVAAMAATGQVALTVWSGAEAHWGSALG